MPNDNAFQPPPLPQGFPLAGVPGANQGIDPAVMNQIRTIAHSALDGVLQWAFSNVVPLLLQSLKEGPQAFNAAVSKIGPVGNLAFNHAAAADDLAKGGGGAQQVASPRVGPFPHGDVDLRFMGANIAPNVQPNRGGDNKRFYFLNQGEAPAQIPQKAADGGQGRGSDAQTGGVEIVGFKPG